MKKIKEKKSWHKVEIIITTQVSSHNYYFVRCEVPSVSLPWCRKMDNSLDYCRYCLIDWAANNVGAILSLTKGLATVSLLIGKFLCGILILAEE